jgi:hypothetical protein
MSRAFLCWFAYRRKGQIGLASREIFASVFLGRTATLNRRKLCWHLMLSRHFQLAANQEFAGVRAGSTLGARGGRDASSRGALCRDDTLRIEGNGNGNGV